MRLRMITQAFLGLLSCLVVVSPAAILCQEAQPKSEYSPFIDPSFQFSQLDAICVKMPVSKIQISPPPSMNAIRNFTILALRERGYRISAACLSATDEIPTDARWVLAVILDQYRENLGANAIPVPEPIGAIRNVVVEASLWDTRESKDAWRNSAKTTFTKRLKQTLALGTTFETENAEGAVRQVLKPLFSSWPRRKEGK
jgi:hypothetical protein